jgi:hypothetical protein
MRWFATAIVLLVVLEAPAQEAAVVIRNATVETMAPAGKIEGATVVVRGGKIESVGKAVAIPDGATTIDAQGGTLLPGLIDPHFEITVAAPAGDTPAAPPVIIRGGRRGFAPAGPVAGRGAFTRVADNFYPHDPGYKPLPRSGLTRLNLVTAGIGQAAVIRLTADDPEHMLVQPNGTAYATVTNSSDSLDQLRTQLEAAAGRGGRGAGGTAPGGGRGFGGRGGFAGRGGGGMAAPTGTQVWRDVHEGKAPLIVTAANSAAIVHLMNLLEPYKEVRLVLFAAGDALYEARDALAGRKVTALLRPGLDLIPASRDRLNAARALHESGVAVAFTLTARPPAAAGPAAQIAISDADTPQDATPRPADAEFPLFPVAIAVKTGLPRLAALEALTTRPAAILGLEKTHGTIEPGKAADLLLYSGDPLDPGSRLRFTLIDGRTVYAN